MTTVTLPDVDRVVRLRIQDWDAEYSSTVVDAAPNRLLLAPPSDGTQSFPLAIGMPVELGWHTEAGSVWLPAVVVTRAAGDVAFGIHFLGPAVRQRQRQHVRASVALDLELRLPEATALVAGTTLDVSAGGMQALVPVSMGVGDVGRFTVPVGDERPVTFTARAVRLAGDHAIGFRFELIAPADRVRLSRYAFQRLRHAIVESERRAA